MPDESAVTVALLRPALLGTYGDAGNAAVLVQRLRWRGIEATLVPLPNGEAVPAAADICLLGGAEDAAQVVMANDAALVRSLRAAAERGAVILGVCAGMQLLGTSFTSGEGVVTAGFDILDVSTTERLAERATGEVLATPDPSLGINTLTGFENHGGSTRVGAGAEPLGRVTHGVGNGHDGLEGAHHGRVFGTYLHGPVLARNPQFADLLLSLVVGELQPLPLLEVDRLREERLSHPTARRKRRRL